MQLHHVRADDWEAFRSIRLAALAEDPGAFGSTYEAERQRDDDAWRDWASKSQQGDEYVLYMAFDAGRPVGMVGGIATDDDLAWLISMWVVPGARRRGIGRSLVDAVLDWAAGIGRRRVGLWVETANTAATSLYRTVGFQPTGETMPLPSNPQQVVTRLEHVLPTTRGERGHEGG